jgi:hypothetical protein
MILTMIDLERTNISHAAKITEEAVRKQGAGPRESRWAAGAIRCIRPAAADARSAGAGTLYRAAQTVKDLA